jgi:NADPH-dependent curcumin reductase CurA
VPSLRWHHFEVFDYDASRSADFMRDMSAWLGAGNIKYGGLIGMLRGDNFGKLIVKVVDE